MVSKQAINKKKEQYKIVKTLDQTDLYAELSDMYGICRDLIIHMNEFDQNMTGRALTEAILQARTHFAMSYIIVDIGDNKLDEVYQLLTGIERLKFLTDEIFRLELLDVDYKHRVGFMHRTYITIKKIQEQAERGYIGLQKKIESKK